MLKRFLLILIATPLSSFASDAQYQTLLQTYHELVALRVSLEAIEPPKGESGDAGAKGSDGPQGPQGLPGGSDLDQAELDAIDAVLESTFANLKESRDYLDAVKVKTDSFKQRSNAAVKLVERLNAEAELLENP